MLYSCIVKPKTKTMSEYGSSPTADPSLRAGNQKKIDPSVLALATDPDSITNPTEKRRALSEASRLTWGEPKVITDEKGLPHTAEEFTRPESVFAFNGTIRASLDKTNPQDQWTSTEQMLTIGGELEGNKTHVIIETDDGEMFLIRRTTESYNGDDQTFTIASTTNPEAGHRDIPSKVLKDVVAMVGEQLILGKDETSGKRLKTRGAITKITAFNMAKGPLDPTHPWIVKPERQSDAVKRFGENMKEAKERELAKIIREPLGEEAVEQIVTLQPEHVVAPAEPELNNPYERFDRKELGQITDNIIGSFVDGVRKYDPAEVTRTLQNLLNVQRELERRFPEFTPEHERNTRDGAVLYATELSPKIVDRIYDKLSKVEGGFRILNAIKGKMPEPSTGESGALDEDTLREIELRAAAHLIGKQKRLRTGDEFDSTKNPYATNSNEELAQLSVRLKQAITDAHSKSLDAATLENNLDLANQVIKGREI